MHRRYKIAIVLVVIILGAYIYWNFVFLPNALLNDVLDGSEFQNQTPSPVVTEINCPEGTSRGHTDGTDVFGNFVATPVCFGSGIFDIYGCGESFVDEEGMVQTVTCAMIIP